jgi:hypothetical protein
MNFFDAIVYPKLAQDDSAGAIATSPGILGWVFTFLMVIGVGFVIFDMVRRIRRVRYREEIQIEISEEQAALEEAAELERERKAREGK